MKIKEIELLCRDVLDKSPKKVQEYKNGNKGLIEVFTGEVMILSKGNADANKINVILKEMLK